jgi:surfactin synthase thioesterase subunit
LDREGDDLQCVLDQLDGPALIFGHSCGALVTFNSLERLHPDRDRWRDLLANCLRETLLESFYREALGFDDAALEALRASPVLEASTAAAHSCVP